MKKNRLLSSAVRNRQSGAKVTLLVAVAMALISALVACKSTDLKQKQLPQDDSSISANQISAERGSSNSSSMEQKILQTFDDITLTLEQHGDQRVAMADWLSKLDQGNYAGHGFNYNNDITSGYMVLYMKDTERFYQSEQMKEAISNGWRFAVESGRYTLDDFDEAAQKLLDQRDRFNIQDVKLDTYTDRILDVFTSNNCEKNLAEMEQFIGMEGVIQLPNMYDSDPDPSKSYVGYFKQENALVYYGRAYVYRVTYNQKEHSRSGFMLQYDAPKTERELNDIIKQRLEQSNPNNNYSFEYTQISVTPVT